MPAVKSLESELEIHRVYKDLLLSSADSCLAALFGNNGLMHIGTKKSLIKCSIASLNLTCSR